MVKNHLIKDSIFNVPDNGAVNPNPSPSNVNATTNDDMINLITRLVAETLQIQGRQIFNSIMNPASDINNDVDASIDAGQDRNLADMDKIPDVVKSLREFSGQPGEFSSWRKSVERIIKVYEHLKGTPKYYGILSVIRNKIVGHADIALESYNTPLSWEKISKCLTLHYADKRDLGTLEYQMTTLVQGHNTIEEFYQMVYQHLSLILNKLSSMEMSQESLNNMTQSYRDKALDTFVRGLKGDLPRLLSIKEPADLPRALHMCLKLKNIDYRTQHANSSQTMRRSYPQSPPLLPPRRNNPISPRPPIAHTPRHTFYPELQHNPHILQRPQFYQRQTPLRPPFLPRPQFGPHHPFPRKPHQKPEPMDVDRSVHSRQGNYMNRPPNNNPPQKRYFGNQSNQMHPPNKFQRVFHNEQTVNEDNIEDYGHDQESDDYNNQIDQTDYTDPQESEELDNINFLD